MGKALGETGSPVDLGNAITLVGLCVYTMVVVTFRLPIADVGILIAALGLFLQLGKVRIPSPVWLYSAFVLWAFVGSLVSRYAEYSGQQVVEQLKLCVVILIVVNALRTEGQFRLYLLIYLAAFMVYPARGALLNYIAGYDLFGRAIGNAMYTNPNDLAALSLLALGVALGFTYSKSSRTFIRACAGVSAILLLLVILLTQSRGAVIGLVVGMGPALVWSGLKRPARLLAAGGILAIVVGLTVPASAWERLAGIKQLTDSATIAQADPEGSAAERLELQKVGWQIFLDHPVFGVGLGTYPMANAAYAPEMGMKDTHNTYLRLVAEVGLPGLVIWCALIASVLLNGRRSRRLLQDGELGVQQAWLERALVAYLVAALFGSYAHLTFPYMMLAVLWSSTTLLKALPQRAQEATGTTRT